MFTKSTGVVLVGALMLNLSANALAQTVTFEVNASVINIYDPGNGLQGSVGIGDTITGTYTIDIATPDNDPAPEYGYYTFNSSAPTSPQQGFDLILNSHSLKTDPTVPGQMYEGYVMNSSSDHFGLASWGNMPLANGSTVNDIFMDLYDPTGQALTSDALTQEAPVVNLFQIHDLHVSGNTPTGNYYYVDAKINSIQATGSQCSPTSTNPVTFNLTATVKDIYDYNNVLSGTVNIGDTVSGAYTFDTTTPDMDPDPNYGFYDHAFGTGNYGFDVTVANNNIKTDSTMGNFSIFIVDGQGWNDYYSASHFGLQIPFINGSTIESLGINLDDPNGELITSAALTDVPPSLSTNGYKEIFISGMRQEATYTAFYTIVADLMSITKESNCDAEKKPVVVSPAGGIFDRKQHFDAAVIVDPGLAPLVSMEATLNGFDITPDMNSCFPGANNAQGRQTFVCPGFSSLLMTGNNILTFTFTRADGQVSNYSTDWYILGDWF